MLSRKRRKKNQGCSIPSSLVQATLNGFRERKRNKESESGSDVTSSDDESSSYVSRRVQDNNTVDRDKQPHFRIGRLSTVKENQLPKEMTEQLRRMLSKEESKHS